MVAHIPSRNVKDASMLGLHNHTLVASRCEGPHLVIQRAISFIGEKVQRIKHAGDIAQTHYYYVRARSNPYGKTMWVSLGILLSGSMLPPLRGLF